MMKQRIISSGLYIAVISIITQLLNGIFEPKGVLAAVINIVSFILTIWVVVSAINLHKKIEGGFISFGKAFKISFLSFLFGGFIGIIFFFIYHNFIDPGLVERTVNETLESTYEGVKNLPEEDQRETLEWTEKIMRFIYSFPGALVIYAFSSLFYALLSLILAAILKKKAE